MKPHHSCGPFFTWINKYARSESSLLPSYQNNGFSVSVSWIFLIHIKSFLHEIRMIVKTRMASLIDLSLASLLQSFIDFQSLSKLDYHKDSKQEMFCLFLDVVWPMRFLRSSNICVIKSACVGLQFHGSRFHGIHWEHLSNFKKMYSAL